MASPSNGAKKDSGRIIGIDLGMTSVIAAHVPEPGGAPQVIPAERGLTTLPAVVGFRDKGVVVVGRAAQDMLTTAPKDTVTGIKRLLGRKMSSQAVKDLQARVGFEIVEDGEQNASVRIQGRVLSPAEVAGHLLTKIKAMAEENLGEPVTRCVLAVPAYFNSAQKAAAKQAAKFAGLDAIKLVHEPTAVALAYGYNKADDVRTVIVDMGGIRLDVSVMEITGNVFDVVATGGDAYLGGANLDARISEWVLTNIQKKYGQDLTKEPRLLMKVRTAAEQAKRELSKCKAVDLQIPLTVGTKNEKSKIGTLRLNLQTVERLGDDLVGRLVGLTKHVLKERGLSVSEIDDVILVGGATRMPLLRKRVAQFFGHEPRTDLPPEELIALGAALLADSLERESSAQLDVLEEPIGIALADGRFMRIVDKDSRLPITRRVMIPTTRDNQHVLEVDVFQGESEDILNTEYLGTVIYGGIPAAKAGEAKVIVDLILGTDRVLTVTSPEAARGGERFEIFTRGHNKRKEKDFPPVFKIATPPANESSAS